MFVILPFWADLKPRDIQLFPRFAGLSKSTPTSKDFADKLAPTLECLRDMRLANYSDE
jgi:hypothetical protein